MRPSELSKIAALLLLTACSTTQSDALALTPAPPSVAIAPPAATVPATDIATAAKLWTRRWWTAPGGPQQRENAVAAMSTPRLSTQLAQAHVTTTTAGCKQLGNLKTFVGHGEAMEVTVTAACIEAGSSNPVVLTVRFARIDGRVLVDAVR